MVEDTLRQLQEKYDNVKAEYCKRGYALPINTLHIISSMYDKQLEKDFVQVNQNDYQNFFDGAYAEVAALKTLTMIKLLDKGMETFNRDYSGSINLMFTDGVPDEQTGSFFNLQNNSGEYINFDRTSGLRLPDYLNDKPMPHIVNINVFREGEQILAYNEQNLDSGVLQ